MPYLDQRYRDPAKAVISSPDDERLLFLLQLGVMAEQMTAKQGKTPLPTYKRHWKRFVTHLPGFSFIK